VWEGVILLCVWGECDPPVSGESVILLCVEECNPVVCVGSSCECDPAVCGESVILL
jgi:hypothetical protein